MTVTIKEEAVRGPSNKVVPGRAYRGVETGFIYICVKDNSDYIRLAPVSKGFLHSPGTNKYIEVDLEITVK